MEIISIDSEITRLVKVYANSTYLGRHKKVTSILNLQKLSSELTSLTVPQFFRPDLFLVSGNRMFQIVDRGLETFTIVNVDQFDAWIDLFH